MTSFRTPRPVPVLLIEDNPGHVEQIRRVLDDAGFTVVHFGAWDEEKLYNYKALNPDSQIVVTDLRLNTGVHASETEGLDLIRAHLWPVDRTTLFVVYSQYMPGEEHRRKFAVEPYWTFVAKDVETKEGPLPPESLEKLAAAVKECRRYILPTLETPAYDAHGPTSVLEEYVRKRAHCHEQLNAARVSIRASCDRLDALARAASYYNRAGAESAFIGIGVYGSCGRMEMRRDSDIECSVYYSPAESGVDERRKLAVAFWNRITRYMRSEDWEFEGAERVAGNPSGLLLERQATDALGNGYQAVFNRTRILDSRLTKEPHVRNRHLQILTELRPVFNPSYIAQLKAELLQRTLGVIPQTVRQVAQSQYFVDLTTQYLADAGPGRLHDWHDGKRTAYRVLNILALRLWLLGRVRFAPNIANPEDLYAFFDEMCDPGIVKVCRFAVQFFRMPDAAGEKVLEAAIEALVDDYAELHTQLSSEAAPADDEDRPMSDGLRRQARSAVSSFRKVFDTLQTTAAFKGLAATPSVRWLFATEQVEDRFAQA
ncbi:MAG TPA: hypothetical protein VGB24_02455 [Longimicrobium sp.]|jgi:CheY-like chemotaxis protein|uniref:response regulator transcription factor n=1 Tax=Longimicrobium sp. TaxID=2029185 RepID=UPI002ED86F0A